MYKYFLVYIDFIFIKMGKGKKERVIMVRGGWGGVGGVEEKFRELK